MRSKPSLIILAVVIPITIIQALYLKALPGSAVRVYYTYEMSDFNKPPDSNMTVEYDGYTLDYRIPLGMSEEDHIKIKDVLSVRDEDIGMPLLIEIAKQVRYLMSFGKSDASVQRNGDNATPRPIISAYNIGLCDRYARLFAAACQVLGIPARIVELNGHVVPEAFLNETGRWVMVDPTLGYYLTDGGVPLSVVEIIRAYRGDNPPHFAVFAEARGDDSLYVPEEEETLRGIYLNGYTVVSNQHLQPLRLVSTLVQTFDLPIAKVQYLEANSPRLGRQESLMRATLSLSVIITLVIAVLALMEALKDTPAP